ncbi:malate synthase [Pseudoalteromonas luteoviolacea B = ATCC 29581]|nr:malate synthase [Pseudoalteromonas luteoviolacea B = ATCC 29581]
MTTHTQFNTELHHTLSNNEQLTLAKQYLDDHCPLESGSHQKVTHYVVYYRHLMAFFDDGSHCGLADSAQFVALCGHKEYPETLLFKKNDGMHVELTIDRKGRRGTSDLAHLDDVQIETPLATIAKEGRQRIWLSFVNGAQTIATSCCKCFTAKDGSDYVL